MTGGEWSGHTERHGGPPEWWEVADALWLTAHRSGRETRAPEPPAPGPVPWEESKPRDAPPPEPISPRRPDSPPHIPEPPTGSAPPPEIPIPEPREAPWVPLLEPATHIGRRQGLARRQALPRELRQFRGWRDDPHRAQVLDEEATAADFATRALALAPSGASPPVVPVHGAGRELALDLTILVDDSLAMVVHQPTVTEFIDLVAPLRVFRTVGVYYFDSDKTEPSAIPLRTATGHRPRADRLFDTATSGSTAVAVVLTDGTGHGWHTGGCEPWLARWGRGCALGIVHLLQRQQWHRTGIDPRRVELSSPPPQLGAVLPNSRYAATGYPPLPGLVDDGDLAAGGVAVPVLGLEPAQLRRWGRFVTRGGASRYRTAALLARDSPSFQTEPGPSEAPDLAGGGAAERVRRFQASASPAAFRLAVLLAAVPLQLSVMRQVQRHMAPESGPWDLTEVLCAGLVHRTPDGRDDDSAPPLEFQPGVREHLLAAAGRRSDILRVLGLLSRMFHERFPWLGELLTAPRQPLSVTGVDEDTLPAARAVRAALDALPGPDFRDWAAQIDREISRAKQARGDTPAEAGPDRPEPRNYSETESHDAPVPDLIAIQQVTLDAQQADAVLDSPPSAPPDESAFPRDGGSVPETPTTSQPIRRGPGSLPPIWGGVPPRNLNFTGREGLLETLHERLSRGTTAVVPHALHGMGGIGKTHLAVEYAYRHREDFDLIWWLPADSATQVRQSLEELARRLGLDTGGESPLAVRAALEALRSGNPYSRWLLIYDAAGDPREITPFLPVDGPGQVLVTSREAGWRTQGGTTLEVDVFSRAESVELLRKRGPRELGDASADAIADKLGDLPLALEQTAVWLYETMMPPGQWLEIFDDRADRLLAEGSPGPDYPRSVAATMNLALDQLERTSAAALQLLQVCSFLDVKPIPQRMFYGARNVDAPEPLAETLADPVLLARELRTIGRYALVRMDYTNTTFQLHRLVQESLKLNISAERREELRHCAHMLLANLDPGDPLNGENWPRYLELLPHVHASDLADSDNDWARQLVIGEVAFLNAWGEHQQARALAEHALSLWRARVGEEHIQVLRLNTQYAESLRIQGDFQDAYDLTTGTVETLTRTRGEEDEETLFAASKRSWDLRCLGDYQGSVELAAETQEKYERIFGRDDPLTLDAAHLHGVALRLVGRAAEARDIDRYNYDRATELFPPEHASPVRSHHAYAIDLMEFGDYRNAMAEMRDVYDVVIRTNGPYTPMMRETLHTMSTLHRRMGETEQAREFSELAWRRNAEHSGPNAPDTLRMASCYALALGAAGALEEALALSEQTVEGFGALFGAQHTRTAKASVNHALLLRRVGRTAEALRVDEEALAVLVGNLGADHPASIVCAINVASDLMAAGQAEAALERDTAAVERCERALPADHPLTLAARRNLILDRQRNTRAPLTEELGNVAEAYAQVFGPDHPTTRSTPEGIRANCEIFILGL